MDNYSKALKRIYDRNKDYPHTHIRVTEKLVLTVHTEVELYRAAYMKPFINQHGMRFDSVKFNDAYPRLDPNVRCYDNAAHLAGMYADLVYCEGILEFDTPQGKFPLAHGWCCDMDGNVIDPTCAGYQHIEQVSYFGIPIKPLYRDWWLNEVGYNGMLDGDYTGQKRGVYYDKPGMWRQELRVKNEIAA